MEKKKSIMESFSFEGPLIELFDEQVPCNAAKEERTKPQLSDANGRTTPIDVKRKKPSRRRKI